MGKLACEIFQNNPKYELVAKLGRQDNLRNCLRKFTPDIVIDLTRADCAYENTLAIIEENIHPVIGTSGLKNAEIQQLQKLCASKKLGGIIAPNFSVAVALMLRFSTIAAPYFDNVEIIETHHDKKFDAPSGTALKTAEIIKSKQKIPECKELIEGARGAISNNIPIHSLRMPGFIARQEVIFGKLGESLTITHNSQDRKSFTQGILLACEKARKVKKLYYGIDNFLNLDAS